MEKKKNIDDSEEKKKKEIELEHKKNRQKSISRKMNLLRRTCLGLPNIECVCAEYFDPAELVYCSKGHGFCKTCIKDSVEASLQQGAPKWICLQGGCGNEYIDRDLRSVFPPARVQSLYMARFSSDGRIALKDTFKQCPECRWGCVMEIKDAIVFPCKKCKKKWCMICWDPAHPGGREECPIVIMEKKQRQDNAEGLARFVAAAMDGLLIRKCPKCGNHGYHDAGDGCNFIYCPCKNTFCYYCGVNVTEADHGSSCAHYNKAKNPNACNLWGGIDQAKRDEVRNKAIADWKAQHPKYVDLEANV